MMMCARLLFLFVFSFSVMASSIKCEFSNTNVPGDIFTVEHEISDGSHDITYYENNLIKGFVSYVKGHLVLHINLLDSDQYFNFRSYIDDGKEFSTDLSTPQLTYWILVRCH